MPDAPSAPPVQAAKSVGAGVAGAAKKLPLWAWVAIISAGILIGAVARRQSASGTATDSTAPEDAAVPVGAESAYGANGYSTDLPTPPIQYSGNVFSPGGQDGTQAPAPAVPAPAPQPVTVSVVTGGGPPTVPPDTHAPAPAAAFALPAGYHAGSTIHDGNVSKSFPGAMGWIRIGSGGSGAAHYIDYHVLWSKSHLERWRVKPNVSPMKWDHVWTGPYG